MKTDIEVPSLARVEGEGALYIRLKNGQVDDIQINIYEPPRFFEGFLRGRYYQEVPDLTARICGICPVAYQMSSAIALERAFEVEISPEVRALRRLLYCGEYIESHALHIYMLQAPDLLGHDSALSMAEEAPDLVQKALRIKKIGNELMRAIGGRSIHPVNVCVGGFYSWPGRQALKDLKQDLEWCLQASIETARWASGLPFPDFEQKYEFVALQHPDEYAILCGEVFSSRHKKIPVSQFEETFLEEQVQHSNALHSRTAAGTPYLTGPLARLNINNAQLGAEARQLLKELGIKLPIRNPYKSLLARAIELVQVCSDALELISGYDPQGPSRQEIKPKESEGSGATEAPRGILYHRYVVSSEGKIRHAKIVPPTAQNLARMEADLWSLAPQVLEMPHEEATLACEHLVRSYDPCISCATHFLKLTVETSDH
jgi:coenzyme F420-reducing hydrogenase alpha subunit